MRSTVLKKEALGKKEESICVHAHWGSVAFTSTFFVLHIYFFRISLLPATAAFFMYA